MDQALVDLVWQRANSRCEYCQFPQAASLLTFEIGHVIAKKHGGLTVAENLALACFYCNSFKGPNIAGLDPRTGLLVAIDDAVMGGSRRVESQEVLILGEDHPTLCHRERDVVLVRSAGKSHFRGRRHVNPSAT